MTKTILILASNPKGDLPKIDSEIRDLKAAIKRNKNNKFIVEIELAVQPENLQQHFLEYHPYIVHFCGHGAGEDGLVLDEGKLLSNQALSGLFENFREEVECVLLNACTTEIQADAIGEYVPYVIGTSREILDRAAYLFAVGFYVALGYGETIESCYKLGCNAIEIGLNQVNLRGENLETARKFEVIDIEEANTNTEPLKIILKRNSNLNNAGLSAQRKPEFVETIQEEVKRKDYKDNLRKVLDRFGQTSIESKKPISTEQRQTFLNKVQDFWIEGFLKPSLYFNTAVDTNEDDSSGQILRPLDNLEVIPIDIDKSYDELQNTDIMGQIGDGKTLLILGEPGSGKTIALLQLAERLIEQSQKDLDEKKLHSSKLIPVVLNLSSWGQKQQPLEEWLIQELQEKYQVPQSLSKPWIKQEQLILLLDGLDEVGAGLEENIAKEQRRNCVIDINKFITKYTQTEIVVCSRVKDYKALLPERLNLSSAICIQPLSEEQVQNFLQNADNSLSGLKTVLRQYDDIREFVQTPLILNMMTWTYQNWSENRCYGDFCAAAQNRLDNLFKSYIEKNLQQDNQLQEYTRNDVLFWLTWLAKRMVKESQTVFLIEKIQPNYLSSTTEQNIYHIIVRLIVGLILGITGGVYLIYFSYNNLNNWDSEFIPRLLKTVILSGLILGVVAGILHILIHNESIEVCISGVIAALSVTIFLKLFNFELSSYIPILIAFAIFTTATYRRLSDEIKPVETIQFNPDQIKKYSILGFISGVLYVLIKLSTDHGIKFYDERGYEYIVFEILIFVIIGGIVGGFKIQKPEIPKQNASPNEGIRRAAKYSLISFATLGPSAALIGWIIDSPSNPVYLIYLGLAVGFFAWLVAGDGSGIVFIQHFTLRLILYCKKYIPWNYARFLDYASKRLLMKKVGGGYVFYHRMLMEHFAKRNSQS